ncbi:MAG: hypothetical protein IPO27_16355 [Bacteroidetes bacterium]|nr:hypothetical protein [Bacteroidota bacterium]
MCYKIEYSDDKVSAWGGFSLMKKFNDKIGLKSVLQNLPIPESKSNNRFENQEVIESFLLSVWLGCYKFSQTHILRLDDTLKKYLDGNKYQVIQPTSDFFKSLVKA